MFRKILIANRGEIAVRIIRACRELGVQTVAVFSEADRDALHVQMADEALCIGPAKSRDSYLNMQNILSAAYQTKAQAIHPGFGFLSENASFALMCEECNVKFIGPKPEVIDLLGNKANAKSLMKKAKVPVIPGSEGAVKNAAQAAKLAKKMGYPVMVKAAAGGGGKGIRIVREGDELATAFVAAQQEAKANFGDDTMYMEKVIKNARHVEVQILADEFGNVLSLGERDCSLQRRNQKVLEEAPSVAVTPKLRKKMGEAAVRAAKAAGYTNAGTIEFLLDRDGNFYFMEMNTRIQVEHPVTEAVTGVDIVKEQIRIAAGEQLKLAQKDIVINGHAIECRINAEDPENNFAPSPGEISYLFLPSGGPGIRVDSAAFDGYTIPPYYDSMIAKVIVRGDTREEAIAKMRRALSEFVLEGVKSNIDFHMEILNNERFIKGNVDTAFIARMMRANKPQAQ